MSSIPAHGGLIMYTGDVWGLTMIAIGVIATTTAFQVLMTAVFGRTIEASRQRVSTRPWASFGVGIATLGVGFGTTAVVAKIPVAGPALAVVIGTVVAILALFGWAATSRELGERMPSPASQSQ